MRPERNRFATRWSRPVSVGEENRGPKMVETIGHITARQQIEQLMLAGARLQVHRMAYEFGPDDDIPEDHFNPFTAKNFDPSDATRILAALADRRESMKEYPPKADPEPSQDPLDGNPAPSGAARSPIAPKKESGKKADGESAGEAQ